MFKSWVSNAFGCGVVRDTRARGMAMNLRLYLMVFALISVSSLHAAETQPRQPASIRFVTQHFPPFSYIEQDKVAGPARVLIDRVCQALKQPCEHQLLPWERGQRLVSLGEAEAMYVIGWNTERSQVLRFSSALLSTEYGFFVRGDDPLHQLTPGSLQGYQIAALGTSNTSSSLQSLQQQGYSFDIIDVTDSQTAFRLLSVGRVDAVYSNREVGRAIIRELQLDDLHYALVHRKLDYFVGFNTETVPQTWVDSFNKQLQALQQQGEAQRILNRYGLH